MPTQKEIDELKTINADLLAACKKYQAANALGDAELLADARISINLAVKAAEAQP